VTPPTAPEPGADPVAPAVGDGEEAPRPQRPKLLPPRRRRIRGARTSLPPRGPHHQRHRATRTQVQRRGLPGPPDLPTDLLEVVLSSRAQPETGWVFDAGRWRLETPADADPTRLRLISDSPDDSSLQDVPAGPSPQEQMAQITAARDRFTTWLEHEADDDQRRLVEAVVAERAATTAARDHAEQLRATQAAVGRAQGAQVRTLAAMATLYRGVTHPDQDRAPGLDERPEGSAAARRREDLERAGLADLVTEAALLLGWTSTRAASLVHLAEHLVRHLPRTLERLESGRLDLTQVKVVADLTLELDAQLTWELDEELFGPDGTGTGLSTAALRTEVEAGVARKDAAAVRRRSRRKVSARRVALEQLGDGISRLVITGPTPVLAAAKEHIDAVAAANLAEARRAASEGRVAADGGDPYAEVDPEAPATSIPLDRRGMPAHRFDAAVRALSGAAPAEPGAGVPTTTLELHVALPVLVGASEDPGWLEGYGWVPAWLVRQGLTWQRCRLRRVLTDPFTGDLVTVDGHTYPASWLTDPGPAPGSPGSPGPQPGGPGHGPGVSPAPGTSGGRPVQRLPPAPSEDDVLGPATVVSGPPGSTTGDAGDHDDQTATNLTHSSSDPSSDSGGDTPDPCSTGGCAPVDPAGCPLAGAPSGGRYVPSAALDRVVRRRWERCTFPGCARRAAVCDVDHVIAHRRGGVTAGGGTTCGCNLEPKCRGHHLLKHGTDPGAPARGDLGPREQASTRWSARWEQWRCDRGSSHWRSPLGFDHHSVPRPAGPAVERFQATPWPPRDPEEERRAGRRHATAATVPSSNAPGTGSRFAAEPDF